MKLGRSGLEDCNLRAADAGRPPANHSGCEGACLNGKDEAAGALLVAKIRTTLGGQAFRDAGGRGELRFDATGKCLLASLSQPQQQQLAALLNSLRGALPK